MTDPPRDPTEPRLEGAGVWDWGRPLWWRRREPIEGATAKDWAEGGLLFILELVVVCALLVTIQLLELMHRLGEVVIAVAIGLMLMAVVWFIHRIWKRRSTRRQISVWESEHHDAAS